MRSERIYTKKKNNNQPNKVFKDVCVVSSFMVDLILKNKYKNLYTM